MHVKKFAATAVLITATFVAGAGTSAAAPRVVSAPSPVRYTAKLAGNSVVIAVDAGSLALTDGQLRILAPSGTVMARLPLSFHVDDKLFPIDATIHGNTAALTPVLDPHRAIAAAPAVSRADAMSYKTREERDKAAFSQMRDQIGFSVTVGAIVGAVVASLAGCVIGGVVALPSAVLTAVFGPLAGCVAAAVIMAPVGAIIGTLFIAAPVAAVSAMQYFTTINAPLN